MVIMVVGGGGREHAIIKKIKENKDVEKIYALPGNGGIGRDAECVPVKATDIEGIVEFAKKVHPDYAVVAPDDPLVMGCVDALTNIGIPCFEAIAKMEEGYLAAFEMSCHQLEFCPYSPHIAVYLNLFEEHLDHYGTFEAYADAKANIFTHQKKGDVTILHKDLMQFKDRWVNEPVFIGSDIDAHDHTLVIPGHELEIDDCALIGEHNYRNLAVAYYIASLYGISDEQVRHAARVFEPLHHRLEDLGEFHGIRCINDSISTIGQASIQAMEALNNVDVILIGGMDRGIAYDELEQYLYDHQNIKTVFMYGTGHRIHEEMKASNRDREGLYEVENLKEAVKLGMSLVQPHHILLLSPAASSYDHFKNFEERGDVFRRLVSEE